MITFVIRLTKQLTVDVVLNSVNTSVFLSHDVVSLTLLCQTDTKGSHILWQEHGGVAILNVPDDIYCNLLGHGIRFSAL